jgi:hypothetical protein
MLIAAIAIQTTRSPQIPAGWLPDATAIPLIGMPRGNRAKRHDLHVELLRRWRKVRRRPGEPGIHAGIDLLADPLHKGLDNRVPVLGVEFVM